MKCGRVIGFGKPIYSRYITCPYCFAIHYYNVFTDTMELVEDFEEHQRKLQEELEKRR